MGAVVLAAIVAFSAWLSAPRAAVALPALAGVALLAVRRAPALVVAVLALAFSVGAALHLGAAPAAAPLWGAGLLAADALAERALLLGDGEVEAGAIVAWLAGVGTLAAGGLAAGALVLVAAQSGARAAAAGLVAAALLAVLPAVLARGRARRGRERGDAR